jgi:hypothetical protein
MTGIVHFRNSGRMSRRAVIAGAAGMALIAPTTHSIVAQTPEASPVVRGGTYLADARDRLRSLLALVPAEALGGPDPTSELFTWLDLEVQLHAHGVSRESEGIVDAVSMLVSTDELMPYAMSEETMGALGFSALDVHQILVAGVPPDRVTIYAGGVDFAALTATWEATGYERKTGDHGDYWTLGEEGEPDFGRPSPLNIGALNNVALLADDIAVFTRSYAALERVLALQGESAADDADLNALIDTLPSDAVNVMALPGATFRADTMVPENPGQDAAVTVGELLAESDDAVGPMPPLLLGMVGVTSGAAPAADGTPAPDDLQPRAFMTFLTGSEEEAQAAADVAFWRLANMQSPTTGAVYSDRFVPTNTPEDAVEGPVMTVEFGGDVASTAAWSQMVMMRDTWPFAWLEG